MKKNLFFLLLFVSIPAVVWGMDGVEDLPEITLTDEDGNQHEYNPDGDNKEAIVDRNAIGTGSRQTAAVESFGDGSGQHSANVGSTNFAENGASDDFGGANGMSEHSMKASTEADLFRGNDANVESMKNPQEKAFDRFFQHTPQDEDIRLNYRFETNAEAGHASAMSNDPVALRDLKNRLEKQKATFEKSEAGRSMRIGNQDNDTVIDFLDQHINNIDERLNTLDAQQKQRDAMSEQTRKKWTNKELDQNIKNTMFGKYSDVQNYHERYVDEARRRLQIPEGKEGALSGADRQRFQEHVDSNDSGKRAVADAKEKQIKENRAYIKEHLPSGFMDMTPDQRVDAVTKILQDRDNAARIERDRQERGRRVTTRQEQARLDRKHRLNSPEQKARRAREEARQARNAKRFERKESMFERNWRKLWGR